MFDHNCNFATHFDLSTPLPGLDRRVTLCTIGEFDDTGIGGGARGFPDTHWSLILTAQAEPAARDDALEELLSRYWKPLYYYARRRSLDSEAAKDTVQGFLARLLERDFIGVLDPAKGRLRSYLLGALDHYLADEWDRASALKRGGAMQPVPMDFDVAESQLQQTPPTPEAAYNYGWALSVLERSLARLQEEFASGRRSGPFELIQKMFGDGDMPSYEDAARQYDMTMPQLKSFLHRARARLRKLLMEEVSSTVIGDQEARDELQLLLDALES